MSLIMNIQIHMNYLLASRYLNITSDITYNRNDINLPIYSFNTLAGLRLLKYF